MVAGAGAAAVIEMRRYRIGALALAGMLALSACTLPPQLPGQNGTPAVPNSSSDGGGGGGGGMGM